MRTIPIAIVDVLNSLLEAEMNSIFRFLGEGSPYLAPADAEIRKPLADMVGASDQHARDLYELIERLGGLPVERGLHPQEQYLAYLSVKFLLPKLIDERKLLITRYENAVHAIADASEEVSELLQRHLAEHRRELAILENTTAARAGETNNGEAMRH